MHDPCRQRQVEPDRITYSTLIKGYCVAGTSQLEGLTWRKMETTIMENQMEKKMENERETGIILG